MKFCTILTLASFWLYQSISAQTIPIWPAHIPNSLPSDEQEQYPPRDILSITHVQVPRLAIFLPTKQYATGQAVLICPGGGYYSISYDWEGTDVAKWLNGHGVAAFVLTYRLPYAASVDVNHLAPFQDVQRAMRLIRTRASEWHIDPNQIGIMGFSAGGHLASTLGTQWDRQATPPQDAIDSVSARPDFMSLIYPVISMQEGITHMGSRKNLIGSTPDSALINLYSNELHVSDLTPPTFLVHSQYDRVVAVMNSLVMYQALISYEVPTEMHLLPVGGHGYSMGRHTYPINTWPSMFIQWLNALKE